MDPKDPKDPAGAGNPPGNPPGNPDPNVIALQKKLSEKDVELKKAQEEVEALKKKEGGDDSTKQVLSEMSETIKKLGTTITGMEVEKERDRLTKAYPDIMPDMLLGKSPEEIERLVKAQRDIIEKNYVRQPSAHAPQYSSRSEVEKEMERVDADKSISMTDKFAKIRLLKIQRDEF